MKKNLLVVTALVIILSLCFSSTVFSAEPLLVGLVFDIGGKGDKSFNDSASRGLAWAAADFGIKRIELEPGVDADREVNLRNLAMIGYDNRSGISIRRRHFYSSCRVS